MKYSHKQLHSSFNRQNCQDKLFKKSFECKTLRWTNNQGWAECPVWPDIRQFNILYNNKNLCKQTDTSIISQMFVIKAISQPDVYTVYGQKGSSLPITIQQQPLLCTFISLRIFLPELHKTVANKFDIKNNDIAKRRIYSMHIFATSFLNRINSNTIMFR